MYIQVLQFSNWKGLQGMGSGWHFCCMGIPNYFGAEDVAMSSKGIECGSVQLYGINYLYRFLNWSIVKGFAETMDN